MFVRQRKSTRWYVLWWCSILTCTAEWWTGRWLTTSLKATYVIPRLPSVSWLLMTLLILLIRISTSVYDFRFMIYVYLWRWRPQVAVSALKLILGLIVTYSDKGTLKELYNGIKSKPIIVNTGTQEAEPAKPVSKIWNDCSTVNSLLVFDPVIMWTRYIKRNSRLPIP